MALPAAAPASPDPTPLAQNVIRFPAVHHGKGPANQLLSELAVALNADAAAPGKWRAGASLGFIFATCGGFWAMAAVLFYTFH